MRLGLITQWVTPELVDEVLSECRKRDHRPGALPAGFIVHFTLALALFHQDSYDDVAEQLTGPGRSELAQNTERFQFGHRSGDAGGVRNARGSRAVGSGIWRRGSTAWSAPSVRSATRAMITTLRIMMRSARAASFALMVRMRRAPRPPVRTTNNPRVDDLGVRVGAGDENRTRTLSLGS
ncbi:transposase domain-containing protein [Streptomyces sp. NPDC005263]|uniref:transposase domain-containing protein n=1 Tax=Streptomyces sp. NPDC005263 TaxID=3364711 RepID=UPI0036CDF125